jgi:hypothetical protein
VPVDEPALVHALEQLDVVVLQVHELAIDELQADVGIELQ